MNDAQKTKNQLISELNELRSQAAVTKESEEALREREERFETAFLKNSTPMAITTIEEGRYVDVNEAFAIIMGIKREEIIGNTSTGIGYITADQRAAFLSQLNTTGRVENLELQTRTKGNELRYGLFNSSRIRIRGEDHLLTVVTDITDRKQAEEELYESEKRFRLLIENAEFPVVVTSISDGRGLFLNDRAVDFFEVSAEDITGLRAHDYWVRPDDRAYFIDELARHKRVTGYECELQSRKGSKRWVQVSANIIEYEGVPAAFIVYNDITTRKRAEEALRDSKEQYQFVVENLKEVVFRTDAEGHWTFLNSAWAEVTGFAVEESLGKVFLEYVYPEDRQLNLELFRPLIERKKDYCRHEIRYMNKDGGFRWIEVWARLTLDEKGNATGTAGTLTDITQRKQAEEALRESEEKYRMVVENSGEAIFVAQGGVLTFVNRATVQILGYSEEEVRSLPFTHFIYPEDKEMVLERHMKRLKGEEIPPEYSFRIVTKDGSVRWMEIHAVVIPWKDQPATLNFLSDITERKRVEGEQKILQARLQRAEKMEALGTLAGGVAHDLNNVLGVLVGYSELLLQNLPQENPLRKHAMQILKGGERAAAIIQDMLTLTRRGVLVSEIVDLNRIISDFLQTPEFEALKSHHPGVTFKTSLDAELLNIKGSPTHLGKTVMNLLSNAAEAITGSGEVLIRTENCYADRPISGYDGTREGEYTVLTISDTGSGISSADLGRIFEPFYTKKVMGRSGTGLGLAVVEGTIKDHDGYIDVQSIEGKGSVFTLYFPVTREGITKAEHSVPRSTYLGRGEHILVIDDVEGQRLLASAMLEGIGYKVDSVAGGYEAVEFVKNEPVDLLILDMIMDPGIDGFETYRRILEIHKDQKAIIVSGFAMTERVRQAQELGAGTYVRKPYLLEKIGIAVRRELDK
jgi:PAS domain S-box-containing protein